jgi:hypothetical protein
MSMSMMKLVATETVSTCCNGTVCLVELVAAVINIVDKPRHHKN